VSDFDATSPPFLESPAADHLDAPDETDGEATTLEGKGLPPDYRMRHDAHYIDQLASSGSGVPVRLLPLKDIGTTDPSESAGLDPLVRSIEQFGILQPLQVRRQKGRYELIAGRKRLAAAALAGVTEVPCLVHHADDERARLLAEADNVRCHQRPLDEARVSAGPVPADATNELVRHLDAVCSCLKLLQPGDGSLRQRVALGLLEAEAQRATWLVAALGVLNGEAVVAKQSCRPAALIEEVLSCLEPELGLSHITVSLEVVTPTLLLDADPRLVAVALCGAIVAIIACVRQAGSGTIQVSLSGSDTRAAAIFEVSQNSVTIPESTLSHFFDPGWVDRPGGYAAAVGLGAARRVAQLHGGRLDVLGGEQGGCQLTFVLPGMVMRPATSRSTSAARVKGVLTDALALRDRLDVPRT